MRSFAMTLSDSRPDLKQRVTSNRDINKISTGIRYRDVKCYNGVDVKGVEHVALWEGLDLFGNNNSNNNNYNSAHGQI